MVTGSCLCEAIEYSVEIIPHKIYNCHCSRCRKAHGATFATQAFARGNTLTFIKGEQLLGEFIDGKAIRAFCTQCGSRLMNYTRDKNIYLSIALANVHTPHDFEPAAHANVESKATWHTPSSDIPSYAAMPDGAFDKPTTD